MKRGLQLLVATMAFAAVVPFSASAASDNHSTTIGTPGDKNCVGQTNAWLAQSYQQYGLNGVGNVAAGFDLTVKDLQAEVQAYCAS